MTTRGGRVTSGTLHILYITVGACTFVPHRISSTLRAKLYCVNLTKVVSPIHPRIYSTVGRTGRTNVGPIVVANSRESATFTVTGALNVTRGPSRIVANTRLGRLDSSRLSGGVRGCEIFTHIRPRRGIEVIGT